MNIFNFMFLLLLVLVIYYLFFVCVNETPDSVNDELLPNSDKCLVKCRPIRATPIKISLDHQKPLLKDCEYNLCNFFHYIIVII